MTLAVYMKLDSKERVMQIYNRVVLVWSTFVKVICQRKKDTHVFAICSSQNHCTV